MKTFNRSLLVALLAFGLYSCSSDSDSGTNPNPTTSVKAKTGSSYTYDSTSSESNILGPITYTIVDDNATMGGRTGVRIVTQDQDTTFMFTYNADGSISMFFANDEELAAEYGEGVWLKIPVAGGSGEQIKVIDSTFIDPEFGQMTIKLTFATSYVGPTTVTVDGKSYSGHNAKLIVDQNIFFPSVSSSTFTWIPELGFYAKGQSTTEVFGQTSTSSETLTSFTLVK